MAKMKFSKKTTKSESELKKPWLVLIVDDEVEVHNITKSVLNKFEFEGRRLDFLSAYTGKDAIETIKEHPDIALVLLDVVMETDDAGLITAQRIREELHNHKIRIVLRTGQPGNAPEKEVIKDYNINDYKEKTELTSNKLYTTVLTALRSVRDLEVIEKNRVGLEKIIRATKTIFQQRSLKLFSDGILTQLTSILDLDNSAFIILKKHSNESNGEYTLEESCELVASTGRFKDKNLSDIFENDEIKELIENAKGTKESIKKDNHILSYFRINGEINSILYVDSKHSLSTLDQNLLDIFLSNVSVAFDNLFLNKELINTQKEIVEKLGEVIESRSKETVVHVKRVGMISYLLARAYGLSEEESVLVKSASPMHDVGKIGIPDSILLKPGKLTEDEFEIMKRHAKIGYDILRNSKRDVLKASAIIAYQHHEKWNGKGYPNALKGEEIHIYARIVALADVFDALSQDRVYKKAWPLQQIIELIQNERGEHFDPTLVDLFFDNLEEIKQISTIKE